MTPNPILQDDESPDAGPPDAPAQERIPNRLQTAAVDETQAASTWIEKSRPDGLPPLMLHPVLKGEHESALGPLRNFPRHPVAQRAQEEPLGPGAEFHVGRHPRDEFDEHVIKERHPDFESVRHAHHIGIPQQLVVKIGPQL